MKFESAMARNIDTCVQTKHKLLFSIKVKYAGEKDKKKIKKTPNDQHHKEFTVFNALARMFFNWIVLWSFESWNFDLWGKLVSLPLKGMIDSPEKVPRC